MPPHVAYQQATHQGGARDAVIIVVIIRIASHVPLAHCCRCCMSLVCILRARLYSKAAAESETSLHWTLYM